MTQSKPAKKKKTKIEKNKENDKKTELKPIPVDKRIEAAINLREMIKQAHKIHKDHIIRSNAGRLTPISSKTSRKSSEKRKFSANNSYDEGSMAEENATKRSKTMKAENSGAMEVVTAKSRSKAFEEVKINRRISEESYKKQALTAERGADGFGTRKEEIIALKQGSAKLPAKKNEVTATTKRHQEEYGMRIEDYRLRTPAFVSLELLDKMKCHSSDVNIYPKKNILRQKRQRENIYSERNQTKMKTKKSEEKNKIKENGTNEKKMKKHGTTVAEKKRNSHNVKGNMPKYENSNSELIPIPKESPSKKPLISESKAKTAVSNPKSVSLNFEKNLTTLAGAGDPFSSNTSHSYFSSDSDVSKIDKKFMKILEAVTQSNLKIDLDAKLQQKGSNTEELKHGIDPDRDRLAELERSELQQKLVRRINSLERKLGNTKTNTENADKKEEGQITTPVVEELWIKEDKFQCEHSGVSLALSADPNRKEISALKSSGELERVLESEVGKIWKSDSSFKKDEDTQKVEREVNVMSLVPESCVQNPKNDLEETTVESGNTAEKEIIKKHTLNSQVTSKSANASKERTDIRNTDGMKDRYKRKPVETLSIIKRLEKAFQTLGLNFEDLESSDEQSSAKKKQPLMKRRESFGKDKRNSYKIQSLKRDQDSEKSSSSKKRSIDRKRSDTANDMQYGVESNGSGDKNLDYIKAEGYKKAERKAVCGRVKDNKINKAICYTSVNRRFEQKDAAELINSFPESLEARLSKKRCSAPGNRVNSSIARTMVKTPCAEGMAMDLDDKKKLKRGKRPKNIHVDDSLLGRRSTKRKSEYSLSASNSLSSMSEDDHFKRHKRKRKSPSYSMKLNCSNGELWKVNTRGTGDATTQAVLEVPSRPIDPQIRNTINNQSLTFLNPTLPKTQHIFKIEERNNELELKQIRERHKQIISEIKTSLNEIKKQHNLFSKLRTQTKKFHKDCHIKRKLIAAYLKDMEETHESRKERPPFYETNSKRRRALSTDSYSYRIEKQSKLRNKTSDCDLELMRLKRDEMRMMKKKLTGKSSWRNNCCKSALSTIATGDQTSSDEMSSIKLRNSTTDFPSTDTAEESFCTVATSLKPVYRRTRYSTQRRKIPRTLCLGWNKAKQKSTCEKESAKQVPDYIVQLLQKLNRIILTEKNQLEDLVVKVSASSNNSSYSGKTKASVSSNSSGRNTPKRQNSRVEEVGRAISASYKTTSSNSSGNEGSRHKPKGHGKSKKAGRNKSADFEEEIPLTRSRPFIQTDPGGSSMDSIADREQEIVISESFPNKNQTDTDIICPDSCSHFDRQEEEFRYRKGDPSFRFRGHLLKFLGEHSRQCRRKTPEEERAYRRKMELERILRVDEKNMKRPTFFSRDSDGHALDFDYSGKGKHFMFARHRQKSIIIDHNRGEENEESQTVLGHASRHSGVGRNRKAPHEYLKVEMMKSESSYQTGKQAQEMWKKSGKKHHLGEVPVNYFEISLNTPGSSAGVSRDADCQTDNVDDYEDIGDIYLWDESGSNHSMN